MQSCHLYVPAQGVFMGNKWLPRQHKNHITLISINVSASVFIGVGVATSFFFRGGGLQTPNSASCGCSLNLDSQNITLLQHFLSCLCI